MEEDNQKFTAKTSSLSVWIFLFILALIFTAFFDNLFVVVVSVLIMLTIGVSIFIYKNSKFRTCTTQLLAKGVFLVPYDYSKQQRNLVTMLILLVLWFFAPFLLAEELSFSLWLGIVLGTVGGFLLYLITYNVYLKSWEKKNHGHLYKKEIWSGTKVTHTGISFVKEE